MKLYIAAPWVDRDDLPAIATKFEKAGHTITWKWWEAEDIAEDGNKQEDLTQYAWDDYNGVREASAIVLLNTKKSEGKAVEQGIAIALGKPIIAIGKRGDGTSKNVFHYLPNYWWVASHEEAITILAGMENLQTWRNVYASKLTD